MEWVPMAARLRALLNRPVRLEFADGEVVEAQLLGADPGDDGDLTYEISRLVREGMPRPPTIDVGSTCVAHIAELAEVFALDTDDRRPGDPVV